MRRELILRQITEGYAKLCKNKASNENQMSSDSPPYEILMSPFNSGRSVEMDIKSYELFQENPVQDSHFPPPAWIAWPFSPKKLDYYHWQTRQ